MCLVTAWIASSAAAQYEAPGPAERCKHRWMNLRFDVEMGQSLKIVADGKSLHVRFSNRPFEVKRFQTIRRLRCRCHSRARASLRNRHQGSCMELSLSRNLLGSKSFVLRHFFVRSQRRFLARPALRPGRRAVKVGRCTNLAVCSAFARPHLDRFDGDAFAVKEFGLIAQSSG